ncbi:MAG: hypothetical protein AMXMBFR84_40720 [Candidatus Hydrogenedentota bacterium]
MDKPQPIVEFSERGVITIGDIQAASVLDALNVDQFGKEVLAHVHANPGINLLLNFEKVEYLSSAVLTELIRINQACTETGGHVRLCALNSNVKKVFEITNLDKFFVVYDEAEGAVKRFARSLAIEADEQSWTDITKDM